MEDQNILWALERVGKRRWTVALKSSSRQVCAFTPDFWLQHGKWGALRPLTQCYRSVQSLKLCSQQKKIDSNSFRHISLSCREHLQPHFSAAGSRRFFLLSSSFRRKSRHFYLFLSTLYKLWAIRSLQQNIQGRYLKEGFSAGCRSNLIVTFQSWSSLDTLGRKDCGWTVCKAFLSKAKIVLKSWDT